MLDGLKIIHTFLFQSLWRDDLSAFPLGRRLLYSILRFVMVLAQEVSAGQLTLRAMSLVYTTLLSFVPLLAVSFSALKAFGVHNQVEPLLYSLVEPLGPRGEDIVINVLGFVENMKVGVLGAMGLALLFYTVISLIQKIENAFNYVWRTKSTRSLSRRFSDYLSVLMVGPILVFSAIGMTASVMNNAVMMKLMSIEPFGTLIVFATKLVPYFFIIFAFTFVYMFVPNTRVRFSSALVGAVVGGVLWQTTGMLFASFAAGSTKYDAIYSGFAILIIAMIWLYLCWLILLFGAQIAYFYQHPEQIRLGSRELTLSNRLRERLTLLIMTLITDSYCNDKPAWTLDSLSRRLQLPGSSVVEILDILRGNELVVESAHEPPQYLPCHDPDSITVADVLRAARVAGEEHFVFDDSALHLAAVDERIAALEQDAMQTVGNQSMKSLVSGKQG